LADISYFTAIFFGSSFDPENSRRVGRGGQKQVPRQSLREKGECVGRFRRIEIRDYRHNTKVPPQNAEDKRSWTSARVISTRRRKFKAAIYSRRRAATRVAPINQPLVGARIWDNIELRRHAC
jgi:hypothetical protein